MAILGGREAFAQGVICPNRMALAHVETKYREGPRHEFKVYDPESAMPCVLALSKRKIELLPDKDEIRTIVTSNPLNLKTWEYTGQ